MEFRNLTRLDSFPAAELLKFMNHCFTLRSLASFAVNDAFMINALRAAS